LYESVPRPGTFESANSDTDISASESFAETATETAGGAISGIADEGAVLLILFTLLLLVIMGGGIYLIYEAPVILSEAAFELVFASSLIKRAKKLITLIGLAVFSVQRGQLLL
jgi:hypothetical protein